MSSQSQKTPRQISPAPRSRLIVQIGELTAERVIRLAIAAATGIVVARHLGPDGLGTLTFAQTVFALVIPVVHLGLPTILTREFSTGDEWRPVLASAMVGQIPAAALAAAVGAATVLAVAPSGQRPALLALVLAPIPLFSLERTLRAHYESRSEIRRIVAAGVTGAATGGVARLAAVALDADVWVIAGTATVESGVVLLMLGRHLSLRALWPQIWLRDTVVRARAMLSESWPLLIASIAVTLYMRADVFMLGLMTTEAETGVYSAAARLSEVWYFLPTAAVAVLRPPLARHFAAKESASYDALLAVALRAGAAVAYVAVVGVLFLADPLVSFLYGSGYADAGPVLRLHIAAAPFVFLGVIANPWFVDRRMSQAVLVRASLGAIINIGLNLALIPSQGAKGAATATLVSYAVSSVLANASNEATRPIFMLQIRALLLLGLGRAAHAETTEPRVPSRDSKVDLEQAGDRDSARKRRNSE